MDKLPEGRQDKPVTLRDMTGDNVLSTDPTSDGAVSITLAPQRMMFMVFLTVKNRTEPQREPDRKVNWTEPQREPDRRVNQTSQRTRPLSEPDRTEPNREPDRKVNQTSE